MIHQFIATLIFILTLLYNDVICLRTQDKVNSIPGKLNHCAINDLKAQWIKNSDNSSSTIASIELLFSSNSTELKINSTMQFEKECGKITCIEIDDELYIESETCNICTSIDLTKPVASNKPYPHCCPKCNKDDLKII